LLKSQQTQQSIISVSLSEFFTIYHLYFMVYHSTELTGYGITG